MGREFLLPEEGGPIGLKLAGVVAKLRMIDWMKRFNGLLKINCVKTYMNVVFVDDQSWAGRALRRGTRWDSKEGKMRWSVEWEREDEDMSEKADKRTFRELRKMGNSLSSDIRMKEDTSSENEDGKLPILDTKMWVESEGEI